MQTVTAAPELITEDALRFTFPLPENKAAFLLFSTEGDVGGVTVEVRQVKPPDGGPLTPEAVRAELKEATVTPRGVLVSLTLDPRYFVAPGEYRVFLFFRTPSGTPSLATTALINRPAADINIDELSNQTVSLTRLVPLTTATNEFLLHLRETTGKVPVSDYKVVGHNLYVKDSKQLTPGEVTVSLVDPAPGMNIAPGAVQTLKVKVANVEHTGGFETRLVITSPSFSGSKTIPLKVNVQDFVLLPLAAIALGVVGAYFARKLVAEVAPRNRNALEILRLENEVEHFRGLVRKPASVETIQGLLTLLNETKENNESGNFAAVTTGLAQLRKQLDEFRKAQVQLESETHSALTATMREFKDLQKDGALTDTEEREIEYKLADIERLLRLGMVEDASLQLDTVKHLLNDLRKHKLEAHFSELKGELAALTLSTDAFAKSELLKGEIQAALDSKELDKVHAKLTELKSFIELQQRVRVRHARGTASAAVLLPDVPNVLPRTTPVTHLRIGIAAAQRIAGTVIGFTIVDVEKIIQDGDELRWYFGDVGSFERQPSNASHRYRSSGRYQVRVEIMRNNELVRLLTEMITILPGQIERARSAVLQDLARNEKLLSAIALVLAIIGGVAILYSGKLFGSLADYVMAVLWGFGLDNSIKGFASVLSQINPKDARS